MSGAFCVEAGKVPAQTHEDCGGSSGHGSAPGGALNTTLRAGSPWWSSGGTTRIKRATPAGRPTHNPKNGSDDTVQWPMGHVVTGVRTSGVAGMPGPWSPRTDGNLSRATVPRNGGHQPKDWQALPFNTVGDHEFFLAFGKCVSTACTTRSAASSVNITRIRYRCRETWICSASQRLVSIGPCAGSSMAVTRSGYLSPLHMMYALNLKSTLAVSSPHRGRLVAFPAVRPGGSLMAASQLQLPPTLPVGVAGLVLSALRFFAGLQLWLLRSIQGLPSPYSDRLAPLSLLVFSFLPRETRCRPRSATTQANRDPSTHELRHHVD